MTIDLAIVFFGMPRSINTFVESIERNLFAPLNNFEIKYRVVGQLNVPNLIDNPRSNEKGKIKNPYKLLEHFPELEMKDQDENHIIDDLNRFSKFGDSWSDNFRSLSNLLHQQQSLMRGTRLALDTGAENFLFIRSDLIYHDSFTDIITKFSLKPSSKVIVPSWQFCGGLNDRFAFALGHDAAEAYGFRFRDAGAFVARGRRPLHSERLLAFSLGTRGVRVDYMGHRASRCRIDGKIHEEDFAIKLRVKLRTNLRLRAYPRSFA